MVHQRRYKKNARPGMKCAAVTGGPKAMAECDSWLPPRRKPGCRQVKKMLGIAIKHMVKLVMKNHFYMVGNEIRRQGKGGAIGNRLTGEMCRNFGKWWDSEMLSKLKRLKIENEMLERYVDDTGVALKGLDPGVRYNEVEDKMEIKTELIESDKDVPEDERTMKELNKIGSSIHPSIKTTFDFPSKNQNLKMPLLDLEVWTENNKVRFSHYEKPMSSKFTIPIQSAHSWKMKMAVLHREAVRRMLNMDKDHSWEEVTSVLNKYSRKLERSGYSSSTRADIIRSAIQT